MDSQTTMMPPGLTGAFYGLDVVEELQVVTSGGQAEFGRALGGYVNVVTKAAPTHCTETCMDISGTAPSMRPTPFSNTVSADDSGAIWSQSGRSDRSRQDILLCQFRTKGTESVWPRDDLARKRRERSTHIFSLSDIRDHRSPPAFIPIRFTDECPRQSGSPVQRRRSAQRALQSLSRRPASIREALED